MKAEKISNWIEVNKTIKNGDIVQITEEGKIEEGEYKGKPTKRFVTSLKLTNGETKKAGFNNMSWNNMINAFGDETLTWVGKEIKVWIVNQNVAGEFKDVVYYTHPNKNLKGEDVNA